MATDDYDPFAERQLKHPTNDLETFFHLVKGSLGAGVLAMPFAFKHIGLWLGIGATICVCLICSYCIHMLVKCSHALCYRHRIPQLSYSEVAEKAFLSENGKVTFLSRSMGIIVNFFIVVDLLGCVCIYLVNAGRSIEQVVNIHVPDNGIKLSAWIFILALPLLFLCLIQDLKFLAPFSLAADILILVSLIITFTFIFEDIPSPSERDAVASIADWPTFFATSIFALECVAVVLPLENDMKNPRHFTGCPSVMVFAMGIVGAVYTVLGFFGYLKYGKDVEANIALNIPVENEWAQAGKIMIAIAIYFTILLQFYVPVNILWSNLKKRLPQDRPFLYESILRIALIILCTIIAAIFPNLGSLLSLVGAFCLSFLGLILPAVFDLVVFRKDPGYGFLKIRLIKDILIIIFGLIGFVTGTVDSLQSF